MNVQTSQFLNSEGFRMSSVHKNYGRALCAVLTGAIVLLSNSLAVIPAHASTEWTAPSEVVSPADEVERPVLAVSENGSTVVAAWRRNASTGTSIEASIGRIESDNVIWGAPIAVSATIPAGTVGGARDPKASISADGTRVFVAWTQRNTVSHQDEVFARAGTVGPSSVTWGTAVRVSGETDIVLDGLKSVLNAAGTIAVLTWFSIKAGTFSIMTRAVSIDGDVITPDANGSMFNIDDQNGYVQGQSWNLSLSSSGATAAVTWLQGTFGANESTYPLMVQILAISEGAITEASTPSDLGLFSSGPYDTRLSSDGSRLVALLRGPQSGPVLMRTASISGVLMTPDSSATQISADVDELSDPYSAVLALSQDGTMAAVAWTRWNDAEELDRSQMVFVSLTSATPTPRGPEHDISDVTRNSYPVNIQLSNRDTGLLTLDTYDATWSSSRLEAVTFSAPSADGLATFTSEVLADAPSLASDFSQGIAGNGSHSLVMWLSLENATKRLLSSVFRTEISEPEAQTTEPVIPVPVVPVMPLGPVMVTGSAVPGGAVQCAAPSFAPAVSRMDVTWLVNGVEVASAADVADGVAAFTVPSATSVGAVLTCRVLAYASQSRSYVAGEATVEPAPPVVTPPLVPTTPQATCKVGALSDAAAVGFRPGSSRVNVSEKRSVRALLGSGCQGSFVVTGYLQSTKNESSQSSLARARAKAVVSMLKAQHPDATFRIVVSGSAKGTACAGISKNGCATVSTE